jgi:hypothetical protein
MIRRFAQTLVHRTRRVMFRPFLWLASGMAYMMRVIVPGNDAYPVFARHGYHLLRKHYYLPIPEEADLRFTQESQLVGLDLNEATAFELLDQAIAPYKAEFAAFPVRKVDSNEGYYLLNGRFMAIDGNVYYGLLRHHRPGRVVEVGSGMSTFLAAEAIQRNVSEGAAASDLVCIEPYPPVWLRVLSESVRLIESPVQEVDLALLEGLGAGDVLFIDSSHVLRAGGDVWWIYNEILPRLASGVLVHIHDISLPKPYPKVYFEQHNYWNEQYLLQAFLTFNARFEVIWPGNYLMTRDPERMQAAFAPEYDLMRAAFPSSEPTSFWMRVR